MRFWFKTCLYPLCHAYCNFWTCTSIDLSVVNFWPIFVPIYLFLPVKVLLLESFLYRRLNARGTNFVPMLCFASNFLCYPLRLSINSVYFVSTCSEHCLCFCLSRVMYHTPLPKHYSVFECSLHIHCGLLNGIRSVLIENHAPFRLQCNLPCCVTQSVCFSRSFVSKRDFVA